MLTKNTLIALSIILVALNAHNLAFDLRSIKYSQGSDYWTVDVPCTGGSGQYTFEYDLPTGWKFESNRIKIPASNTQQVNNQYVVRCRVKDSSKGDILERSLCFKPFSQGTSYSLEVTDHDYFYGNAGLSTYSQETTSIHGIDVLSRLGALVKNTGVFGFDVSTVNSGAAYYGAGSAGSGYGVGAGASATVNAGYGAGSGYSGQYSSSTGSSSGYGSGYSSSYSSSSSSSSSSSGSSSSYGSGSSSSSGSGSGSSTSLYTSLPSISQLEKYIYGGDIVEIIQTIQLVVDSKVKCEAKAAYLSDFLGRICAAIEVKKYALNQLKVIVSAAVTQVQKLTVQITSIRSQQASLKISELKTQLDTLISKLKIAYDEYNNFNSNYSSYETEIVSLEKEINEINSKYSEVQKSLETLRRNYQSIDSEIAQYEARIKLLREKKTSVQKEITSAETFIKEKDVRIKEIKEKISILKAKVSNVSTQKDKLKQVYLELEQRVNSAKSIYESATAKYESYEQQIVSITVEIERYQKQTSELEVKQVAQCVENLESAITEIKESIDFVQYHCFDATDIEIDHDSHEKRPCYHFGQSQWYGYVNKCYSNLAEQIRNRITSSFKTQVIEISTINVFSDSWKQNYGSCFQKDIVSRAQNYKSDKSFGFDSDFSCSDGFSSVESKSGVIQSIAANSVVVRGDDGKDYTLRLGSCSRFEGQGKEFVPKKGHNILWKGSKQNSSYNLHSCTCY